MVAIEQNETQVALYATIPSMAPHLVDKMTFRPAGKLAPT